MTVHREDRHVWAETRIVSRRPWDHVENGAIFQCDDADRSISYIANGTQFEPERLVQRCIVIGHTPPCGLDSLKRRLRVYLVLRRYSYLTRVCSLDLTQVCQPISSLLDCL